MAKHNHKVRVSLSPAFDRYAELYPSVGPRIAALLANPDPEIQRRIAFLAELVREQEEARRSRLAEQYDLTPAESRVAMHIIDGGDIASYALEAGVSPGTARSQLKSIFAKTGVNRQSALVLLGLSET
jgi:DNA-binding CsgD family transcriptional regulator